MNDKTNDIIRLIAEAKRISKIKQLFLEELPIKFQACLEIQDEKARLKGFNLIVKEYQNYLIEWGHIKNIHFVDTDSGQIFDIEQNIDNDKSFFNQEEANIENVYNQYYKFCLDIMENGGDASVLLEKKIKFKNSVEEIETKKNENVGNTGFTCNLHPDTVKEIYNYMTAPDKAYLSGELSNFQAIFANTPTRVPEPVKWLIKSQKKPYRGHQTKLYLFIETMLNGKFSAEDKRKAADLFIDEKGKFFNPKMKEPNENDRDTHNIFETLINNIKEKTRPA